MDRGKGRAVDDDQDVERFGSPEDMEVDKDSDVEVNKDSMVKAGKHAAGTRPGPSVQPGTADSSGVSGSDSSPPHGRGRSRTRRPKKRAKLAAAATTDDENDTEPVTKRIKLSVRDIDTPGTGYAWVSDDERCQFVVPSTLAAHTGNALAQSWLATRRLSFERRPEHDRRPGVHQLVV